MSDTTYIYVIIIGMAIVTYITRETPFLILGNKKLGSKVVLWLSFIPVSVMSALLMPELLIKSGDEAILNLSVDNLYIWAGAATFIVAFIFKNFFLTIIFGMGFLSLLRYLLY